jgi:hypothetical protein
MSSGLALFHSAEVHYAQGDTQKTFDLYQQAIKKILKDENVTGKLPYPNIPSDTIPRETLGYVWHNFVGFFRDPAMSFTEQSDPEAFKLLYSFRPSTTNPRPKFERTARGKILLKGMQITAGLTLGLMAWDKRDRATAAKRYKEALDLAATHPPFLNIPPDTVGLERWVYGEVEEAKSNLGILVHNDTLNAQMVGDGADGRAPGRRGVANLPLPQARLDKSGAVTAETSYTFATDACAKCRKRDVKLLRCSACKKVSCKRAEL